MTFFNRRTIFIFLVLVAIVAGGAVRVSLHSFDIQNILRDHVARYNTEVDIQFKESKILLSEGIWPRLGLELKGVTFSAADPCVNNDQLRVERMYLPVSLRSLFQQQVGISAARVFGAQITDNYYNCPETIKNKKTLNLSTGQKALGVWRSVFEDQWKRRWTAMQSWGGELYMDSLVIAEKSTTAEIVPILEITKMEASFTDAYVRARVKFTDDSRLSAIKNIHFEMQLNANRVWGQSVGQIREGRVYLDFDSDLNKHFSQVNLKIKDTPLAAITDFVPTLPNKDSLQEVFKDSWITSRVQYQGFTKALLKGPYKMLSLEMNGENGRLISTPFTMYTRKKLETSPFEIYFSKVSVKNIFESFFPDRLRSWMKHYGTLKGVVLSKNINNFKVRASWEKLGIVLSAGQKAHQDIQKLEIIGRFKDKKMNLDLLKPILTDGSARGWVKVSHNFKTHRGMAVAEMADLSLNQELQKFLVGRSLGLVQFKSRVKWLAGAWTDSEARIQLDIVDGAHWQAQKVNVQMSMNPKQVGGRITAQQILFRPTHAFQRSVTNFLKKNMSSPVTVAVEPQKSVTQTDGETTKKESPSYLAFNSVVGKVVGKENNGWRISQLRGQITPYGMFSFSGHLEEDKRVRGQMTFKNTIRSWKGQVSGRYPKLQFTK